MQLLLQYLASAGLVALALGQTPPNTEPAIDNALGVSYGSTIVTPGLELPLTVPRTVPTINYPTPQNQTYVLLCVDLSISTTTLNTTAFTPAQLPLAPGITTNRTTRLHLFQTDLTFATNGTLINTTSPIAFYNPPQPPPGDVPHAYVFYLFEQNDDFSPPEPDSPFSAELVDQTRTNRFSFNTADFATENALGSLVGANYFVARNSSTPAATTTGASATGSAAGPTSTSTTPFLGAAGRLDLGFTGAVVTALALVSAFAWAT